MSLPNKTYQLALLILVTSGIYFNSLFNQYSQDDKAVTYENKIIKKGIKGTSDIFTHHYFFGAIDHNTGIYRPLPSLTHALEWQLFGKNPFISHLINLLLYLSTILILYYLLTFLFRESAPDSFIPFLATLLFSLHPVHTEVVATIKGRDELLSLLLMLLAVYYFIKNHDNNKLVSYIISGSLFFLSLLSKESSVLMIAYLSLILYFFTKNTFLTSVKQVVPFLFITGLYLFIRYRVIGPSPIQDVAVFNFPYMYASPTQAFATKVYVLNQYLKILFFPHPLLSDYTYNQIPYIHLADIRFFTSLFISLTLLGISLFYFFRKNLYAFCILFHFISLSIASNLIVKTSLLFAERTIYVGSIGFCLCIAYSIHLFVQSKHTSISKVAIPISYILLVAIIFLFSTKTIMRNPDWKDDYHLYNRDVVYAPDNARLLTVAASLRYFHNPEFKDQKPNMEIRLGCIRDFEKAIAILPSSYPDPYASLSYIYFQEDSLEKAIRVLDRAKRSGVFTKKISDGYVEISKKYVSFGRNFFEHHHLDSAYFCFKKATELYDSYAEAWWLYGGVSLEKGDIKTTVSAWEKTIRIDPGFPQAKELLEKIKADYKGKY